MISISNPIRLSNKSLTLKLHSLKVTKIDSRFNAIDNYKLSRLIDSLKIWTNKLECVIMRK